MGEWQVRRLGELIESAGGFIRTGPFGSQLHADEYTDDPRGVPVVMPKDMRGGRISRDSVSRVTEATAERLRAHRLVAGDLVLARRGDVGRLAAVASDEAGWICGTGSMRIHAPDHNKLDPKFLQYAMCAPRVGDWLVGQAVGATMPNLNARIVFEVPIPVPGIDTQGRIALILAAFDRLIEINERRIALLEGLCRALYRDWFARFPWSVTEDAGSYGPAAGPARPGWSKVMASELMEINPRMPGGAGPFQRVTMADLSTRYSDVLPSTTAMRASGSKFQHGDVLMARITPSLENGKTGLVLFLETGEMGVGSTEFIVLRGKGVGPAFVYLAARDSSFRDHAIKSMSGASGRQRVANDTFDSLPMLRPSPVVASAFESVVMPMLELVFRLRLHSDRLAETRDLLLPSLVTGALDISNIDLDGLTPIDF